MGGIYQVGRHNRYLWSVPFSWMKFVMSSADESAAAVGGTYEFTRSASANLRERDDSLNTAIGGFLAGSILGLRGE